jgi:aryl-phospho-beta-D-glucosidase BglC (GH1 family)
MTYVARLDQVIGWAESNNVYVILDLHNNDLQYPFVASWITDPGFFTNASQQQSFIDVWTWLSQRYQNNTGVLYNLINEPYSPAWAKEFGYNTMASMVFPTLFNSSGLYARTIQAIRANDDNKICVVNPVGGDTWSIVGTDNVTYPIKLADSNVLYSPHWYYPSNSGDDMSWYNSLVTSAYQFSVDNNVPIFAGEWGIPWRLTTLNVTEQTYWTQEHCQTYANLGFNWCYWSFKEDNCAIYYSDEGSAIFNDTLRPMASVLIEYMSETAIPPPP